MFDGAEAAGRRGASADAEALDREVARRHRQLAARADRRGRAEHPAARHPRAAHAATCRPRSSIDEAVRLAHWFGGRAGAGVRQRRARPGRPHARPPVNILLVNWQDLRESAGGRRRDPPLRDLRPAGGARAPGPAGLLRLAGRRARRRRCDGIEVHRVGGRHSFALLGRRRGAAGARGGAPRRRGRGHQQAAAVPRRR